MNNNAKFLGALGLALLTTGLSGCKKKEAPKAEAEHAAAPAESVKVDHAAQAAAQAAKEVQEAAKAAKAAKAKAASLVPDVELKGAPAEKLVTLLSSTVVAISKANTPEAAADTLRGVLKKYDVPALRAAAKAAKAKNQGASKEVLATFKAQKAAYKKIIASIGKQNPEVVGPAAAEFAKVWGLN